VTGDILRFLAAVAAGCAGAAAASLLVRPGRSLLSRTEPYLPRAKGQETRGDTYQEFVLISRSDDVFVRLFSHLTEGLARMGFFGDQDAMSRLELRIRQAGRSMTVAEFWARSIGNGVVFGLGGLVFGLISLRDNLLGVAGISLLSFLFGLLQQWGRIDSTIQKRASRMRLELYTINHMLAIYLRTGSGVVQAMQQITERSTGEIAMEMHQALYAIRGGMPLSDALRHSAMLLPEPYVGRTFTLLAVAGERGTDLADALLRMSEDVRDARLDELRREGTRKKGAMLIPTLLILAPVTVMFVGAPLVWVLNQRL